MSQAALAAVAYRQANRPEHQTSAELDVQNTWLMARVAVARTALFLAGIGLLLKAVYADREGASETMPEESADRQELTAAVHSPGKYPATPPTPTGFPILSTSHFE